MARSTSASRLIWSKRIWTHREAIAESFSQRYKTSLLVYFEQYDTMEAAITREKQLKKWCRAWKVRLIEEINPAWKDLWPLIVGESSGAS